MLWCLCVCTDVRNDKETIDQSINHWSPLRSCKLVQFSGHDNANTHDTKVENTISRFIEIGIQTVHIVLTFDKYHIISGTESGGVSMKIWLHFEALLRNISHIVSHEKVAPQLGNSSPWKTSITNRFNSELKDGKAKLFAQNGLSPCELATFQSVRIQISRSDSVCLWHWVANGANIALLRAWYLPQGRHVSGHGCQNGTK